MKKDTTIIVILIAVVLSFSFYWFSFRPSKITKKCHQDAKLVEGLMIKANKSDDQINYTVDKIYQDCLKDNGIKN